MVWARTFEAHRRVVMGAGLLAASGHVQRTGATVHLIVERLSDLSAELASVGHREVAFLLPRRRGDERHQGGAGFDPRGAMGPPRARDIYHPDLRIEAIRVAPKDFR